MIGKDGARPRARRRRPLLPWPRQIVLCGASRGGTTLLYNMMRGTVRGAHCPDSERTALRYLSSPRPLVVTKRPLDVLRVETIRRGNWMGKRLTFVFVLRDPRSLVSSTHRSVPGTYFQGFDYTSFVADGWSSYSNPGLFAWAEALDRARALADIDYSLVRYEDLVADADAEQARLAEDLDLAFDGRFSEFHLQPIPERLQRALNGVRPPDPGGIDAWRRAPRLARVVRQFTIAPALFAVTERWGYGADRGWFDAAATLPPAAGTVVEAGAEGWRGLAAARDAHRGPILALAPGARLAADPWPYLALYDGDLALYVTRSGAWSGAAVLIADTPAARALLAALAAAPGGPAAPGDDARLREAARAAGARVEWLPPTFAWGLEAIEGPAVPHPYVLVRAPGPA